MKASSLFVGAGAGLLSAGALFIAFRAWSAEEKARVASVAEARALGERLERVAGAQEAMLLRLSEIESRLAAVPARAPAPTDEAIGAAVSRWLESHRDEARLAAGGETGEAPGSDAAGAAEAARERELDFDDAIEGLFAAGTPQREKERLWRRLHENGWLDRAIAAFEKRARENPSNADCQSDAGMAYVQKLVTTSNEIEKGTLATKADRAFDAALAIDPGHWEARFSKATSLSFWPPLFGKQPEAIRQFETLIAGQEGLAPRPEFAQPYVFLGNLYRQQGKSEKAIEVWRKGAELFPGNKELSDSLASE